MNTRKISNPSPALYSMCASVARKHARLEGFKSTVRVDSKALAHRMQLAYRRKLRHEIMLKQGRTR